MIAVDGRRPDTPELAYYKAVQPTLSETHSTPPIGIDRGPLVEVNKLYAIWRNAQLCVGLIPARFLRQTSCLENITGEKIQNRLGKVQAT